MFVIRIAAFKRLEIAAEPDSSDILPNLLCRGRKCSFCDFFFLGTS